jgi:hypothetical protein
MPSHILKKSIFKKYFVICVEMCKGKNYYFVITTDIDFDMKLKKIKHYVILTSIKHNSDIFCLIGISLAARSGWN